MKKYNEVEAQTQNVATLTTTIRDFMIQQIALNASWMKSGEEFKTSYDKYRTLHKFTSVLSYIKTHLGSIRKMPKANVSDWDAIFARVSTELDLKNNKVA